MKKHYVGLDISDKETSIRILDESGEIVKQLLALSNPKDIERAIRSTGLTIEAIGLETGAMTDWIAGELKKRPQNEGELEKGLWTVKCLDSYKMSRLISMNINKNDSNDGYMVAEALRIGCFSKKFNLEVHTKSPISREIRSLIKIRQNNVGRRISIYNEIRGTLKSFGVILPTATPGVFCEVVKEAIKNLPPLITMSITSDLNIYDSINKEVEKLTEAIEAIGEENEEVKLLTELPGIGVTTAIYFMAAIEDPKRFKSAKNVGAYFGLTPEQYSSGESNVMKGISKRGDSTMRSLLFEAATTLLYRTKAKSELKSWGLKLEKKIGSKKARIAVARKLAIMMFEVFNTKKHYIEKPKKPKQKKEKYVLTTEELQNLLELSKEHGCVSVKNAQQLKPLAMKDCQKNQLIMR